MNNLNINVENTNVEILARIVKAEAKKYDCSVDIDFNDGKRVTRFVGDKDYAPHILEEIEGYFKK